MSPKATTSLRQTIPVVIILSFILCFVYNSNIIWSTDSISVSDVISQTPYILGNRPSDEPPKFEPLKQAWFLNYLEIHKREHAKILRGEKPRMAVFRFTDGGWGNRMRAQYFVFMLAIFTDRMFVTDHDDMLFHFGDPHPEMPIFWKNLQKEGLDKLELSSSRLSYGGYCNDMDSLKHLASAEARSTFNERYSQDILEFVDPTTPEICMFKEGSGLVDFFQETFQTKSRFSISGQLTSVLLANPAPVLIETAAALKKEMKWDSYERMLVIQLRMFVDYWPMHESVKERLPGFWRCVFEGIESNVTSDIAPLFADRRKIAVWFTTDETALHAEVIKNIEDRGYTGVLSPFEPAHTSFSPAGLKYPIVEWFLIGESYATFTLGTTFAQFALARNYWSSRFYQYQGWPPGIEEWFGRMPYWHAAVPAWGEYCGQDICF